MTAALDLRASRDLKPSNSASPARPLTVPPLVSGQATVRRDALAHALGPDALAVLETLWGLRDRHTGLTRAGNALVARRALREDGGRLTGRRVKRACALLHRAALLVSRGVSGRVKLGHVRGAAHFVRLVRGDESASQGVLLAVPPATAAWVAERLRNPPRRGGRRAGAGAPKGNQNWRGSGAKVAAKRAQKAPQDTIKPGPTPHNQRGPGSLEEDQKRELKLSPSLREGERAPGSGTRGVVSDPGSGGRSSAEPAPPVASGGQEGDLRELRTPSVPARPPTPPADSRPIGGVAAEGAGVPLQPAGLPRLPAPPRSTTDHLPGAPNFPTLDAIGCAVVPPPPPVLPEMSEPERAKMVADAYAGAVRARHGKPCWAFRGSALITRSKHYAALVRLAARLLELGVAPGAWMAWSFDFWARTRPGVPPVAWALSVKRLDERLGWFRSEESSYRGGDVKMGRKTRALARRCQILRDAVARVGAWSGPRLAAYVQHFFPGPEVERIGLDGRRIFRGPASYVAAVLEAQEEAEATQREMRESIQSGGFPW